MASYHPDGWSIDSLVGTSSSERLKSAARGLFKTFCWAELLEVCATWSSVPSLHPSTRPLSALAAPAEARHRKHKPRCLRVRALSASLCNDKWRLRGALPVGPHKHCVAHCSALSDGLRVQLRIHGSWTHRTFPLASVRGKWCTCWSPFAHALCLRACIRIGASGRVLERTRVQARSPAPIWSKHPLRQCQCVQVVDKAREIKC